MNVTATEQATLGAGRHAIEQQIWLEMLREQEDVEPACHQILTGRDEAARREILEDAAETLNRESGGRHTAVILDPPGPGAGLADLWEDTVAKVAAAPREKAAEVAREWLGRSAEREGISEEERGLRAVGALVGAAQAQGGRIVMIVPDFVERIGGMTNGFDARWRMRKVLQGLDTRWIVLWTAAEHEGVLLWDPAEAVYHGLRTVRI